MNFTGSLVNVTDGGAGQINVEVTTPASDFPYTGSAVISGSLSVTGSVRGNIVSASIASSTASLDFTEGNFFTLALVSGNTFINVSNIEAGQTVNVKLATVSGNTVSFSSNIKEPSGSLYEPSNKTSEDVVTFISYDSTNAYLSYLKSIE